ncbi:Protoheme IX farnesyltransferase [Phytophthora nicotianae]|uniref:Heme O synthase n=1 Tax=Phytophthora nicotianae TaxID=4792 RepID=A0A0W8BK41_PHYNI|nr:Protoheme IX farnesyltransferase [Phytophthora nicotianae]
MLTLAAAPRARAALLAMSHGRRPVFRVPPHVIRVLSTRPTTEVAAATSTKAAATAAIDAADVAPLGQAMTLKERLTIYSQLGKARLSALVVMTTGAGFLMAGGPISWSTFAAATVAILAAGCSPLVASLGAFNIGLYSLVYTPMKMKSELNTWMGSIVGAIPPVMGWAAATGTVLAPEAALHAYLLYCWQMPHFFALSWRSRKDYGRGGYKMVACNDPTGSRSAALALRYSYYMGAIPIVAALTDATSYMFAVEGTVVNAYTIYLAHKFYAKPNNATAQKVFLASLWYLPVIMGCMVLHSQQWMDDEEIEAKKEANVWREAFLGEVENFQSQDPSAHFDESSMSAWLVSKVRAVRHSLRDFCIHESLWGVRDGQHNADESNVLCPVHVGHQAKETVAITAQASRKDL